MYVATCEVRLHIPQARSLKDKRQVVQSLLDRVRRRFNVAAAEVGAQDVIQQAIVGFAVVSGEGGHARNQIDAVVRYVETMPSLEVVAADVVFVS